MPSLASTNGFQILRTSCYHQITDFRMISLLYQDHLNQNIVELLSVVLCDDCPMPVVNKFHWLNLLTRTSTIHLLVISECMIIT